MSALDCDTCGHCTRVPPSRPGFGITEPCGIAHEGDENNPAYRQVLRWLNMRSDYQDGLFGSPGDCPGHRPRTSDEQAAWDKVLADVRASIKPKACRHCGGVDP